MNKQIFITCMMMIMMVVIPSTTALTLQVEPKTEECYFQQMEAGQSAAISYSVTRGGLLDIDVRIYDTRGNTIYQGLHYDTKMKGRQQLTAHENGVYKICFNNEMSRFTAKVVSFSVVVEQQQQKKEDVAKATDLTPMENSVVKVERTLQNIIAEQRRMRIREQVNRDTSESTNGRVQWWSIAETGLIVFMGVGQVFYLRRWFNVKSHTRV
eukprot:TRINITY_DN3753_c0_g3_i1.p1 TRINITY_DN3753_c0_g3~~TRINITY_DN3753_c0_g3_i1.p1  ORF type:complete len:211 (-),score=56.67 TRINITY_DN3753_c0_g3_i1:137-769(-)